MKWALLLGAAAALATAPAATPARANDAGAALAGGVAGFVGGMIVGNSMRPHYAPPPRAAFVDDDPPPVYCHWANGRAYYDEYEGVWRHRRVRVCD